MITILINGESKTIAENLSVTALLQQLNYTDITTTAIAINLEFVSRSNYDEIIIQANDDVEIVTPMQGG